MFALFDSCVIYTTKNECFIITEEPARLPLFQPPKEIHLIGQKDLSKPAENITCSSPEARPAPALNIYIGNYSTPAESKCLYDNSSFTYRTFATVTRIKRRNENTIRCCYVQEPNTEVCSLSFQIVILCKLSLSNVVKLELEHTFSYS